mmetsp:Transcript_15925/g.29143  ORF Transcript_15925/g.29143 Transcript_15925/m.29143 type:complete len:98 (+) Transcript_15925:1-294(+)
MATKPLLVYGPLQFNHKAWRAVIDDEETVVATCDFSGIVRIWDVNTARELHTCEGGIGASAEYISAQHNICLAVANQTSVVEWSAFSQQQKMRTALD